jgi:hypothetical protein
MRARSKIERQDFSDFNETESERDCTNHTKTL